MSDYSNENCTSDHDVLCNYVPDQTVISKRKILPLIKSLKYKQHVPEPLEIENWYPYVNSYYHSTEDVDAYARVSHLIETKQSFTSLRSISYKQTSRSNFYSEEDSQLQYLNSKPECFLILGKPGIEQEALGQRLAEYWKCVYIHPLTLLEEAIESGDRSGECIEFNLRCGRAIGVEVIMRLLSKKIQTPSARHRGYVVCGLPLVPNDLFQEDPISSESAVFNVKEIFEEIIDNTITNLDRLDVSQGSKTPLKSETPSIADSQSKISTLEEQSLNKIEDIDLSGDFICSSNICVRTEMTDDSEKQINCLFGLFSEPFIIIYVTCPNADVISKRDNCYFDIYSKKSVDIRKVKLFMQVGVDDEDLLRDVFEDGNPFEQNFRHIAKVPENLPANVATQLDCYHRSFANLIDHKILLHDVQCYIKLDGRAFITRMLNIVKTKLRVLPLQKVLIPKRLNISLETEGEGAEPNQESDSNPEETFLKLRKRQITAPPFKWTWSNWKTFCPVSMRDSNLCVNGDSNYAVQFMNKIFFLADNEAYLKFLEDPRFYLLPPFPKSSCKIFIFGPPASGKTALAECLHFLLNGEILHPVEMETRYITQKQTELMERFRQVALLEGVKLLDEQRQIVYLEELNVMNEAIREWEDKAVDLLGELVRLLEVRGEHLVLSPFPLKVTDRRWSIEDENELYTSRLGTLNLPFLDKAACLNLINNKQELHKYLPEKLRSEIRIEPATVSDSFVQNYASEKCQSATMDDLSMTDSRAVEMYVGRIREIEEKNEYDGWIIDGMTTDVALIDQICDVVVPNTIVILQDTPQYEFLMNRIKTKFQNRFRDYKQFFLNIGEKDAAWRSPSYLSTPTFRNQLAEEILTDIVKATVEAEGEEIAPESFDNYKEELIQYHNHAEKITKLFEERNQEVNTISVTDLSIEELMEEVVNKIRNTLRVGASKFTETDRAEEVQEMLTENVSTEGEGAKQELKEIRKFGDTYNYCPVTFSKFGVLWKGKEEFAAKFKNKIYLLSSEDALINFLRNPRKYLVIDKPQREFPPPRLCVVGVHGSGKTTVSKLLAENLGVYYFNYHDSISSSSTDVELKEYLNNNETLPTSNKLVTQLWFEEPIKSLGFVVDDYPKRPCDVDVMVAAKAIPDVIIYIAGDQSSIYNRLLQKSLSDWGKQMQMERDSEEKRREEILQNWENNRQKLRDELMQSKREFRYSEKSQELVQSGLLSETQVSFDSVGEQEDDKEVTKILDKELPEPSFSDHWETENDATDRFRATIEENYFNEIKFVYDVKSSCELNDIPWSEINGNFSDVKVAAQALLLADRVKFRNKSLFETCFDVTVENAEKLLEQGFYFLSKFGKTCPVQIYEKFNPIQMFLPMEREFGLFPVVHRQYIYFIAGVKNRKKFVEDPLEYTEMRNFNFPLIPFKLAVIGPPKCGKTRLSNRYSRDLGLKVISRGQAARFTLKILQLSKLAQAMDASLRLGNELTTQEVMESVQAATIDALALTQGTVFDGFPNTIEEMKVLAKLGIVPSLIMDLTVTDQNIFEFASNSLRPPPIYSKRFTKHLLKQYKMDEKFFRVWCDREYQNIFKLPVTKCLWGIWEDSKEVALAVFSEIKHYYSYIQHDWPLRLGNMLVTPLEFIERQSRYKSYCPGCWKFSKKLNNGGEPPDRTGLIHYRNYFYWLCKEHVEEFLKIPEEFMPPASTFLPPELPGRVKLEKRPENLSEDGLCLVCYTDNQPQKVLNEGDLRYCVSYNHKYYLFDYQHCLDKFLASPDQYFETTINFKRTVTYASLDRENLPVLGFLEQFVSRQVVKAVNHVAIHRPVIPGLSVEVSGIIGVGLHLKVFNENTPDNYIENFQNALEKFHLRRNRLISNLDQMKICLNPRLGFEPNLVVSETDRRSDSLSSDNEDCAAYVIDDILDNRIDFL